MDTATLKRLRPADASAEAIESSIERMRSVLTELRGELAANQGARRGALLTGSPADLEKNEARTRALQIDIERIEASVEVLQPELVVARGRERLADLETMRIEAERAAETFSRWWNEKYEPLAKAIAAGLELEATAHRTRNEFIEAVTAASRDADVTAAIAAGSEMNREWPRTPLAHFSASAHGSPRSLVCLPALQPGPPIHWPYGFVRERIKRGTAAIYA